MVGSRSSKETKTSSFIFAFAPKSKSPESLLIVSPALFFYLGAGVRIFVLVQFTNRNRRNNNCCRFRFYNFQPINLVKWLLMKKDVCVKIDYFVHLSLYNGTAAQRLASAVGAAQRSKSAARSVGRRLLFIDCLLLQLFGQLLYRVSQCHPWYFFSPVHNITEYFFGIFYTCDLQQPTISFPHQVFFIIQ